MKRAYFIMGIRGQLRSGDCGGRKADGQGV